MYRLTACVQLQANQTAVTNTDDIAAVSIDRSAGLQRARIKQVTYSKRTAGTRFFIHYTRDNHLLMGRVN